VVGVVAAAIAAPLLLRGLAATLARLVRLAVIPVRLRIAAPSVVAIPVAVAHPVIGDSIMKKYLAMLVTLAVTLFAVNSFAWDPPASPAPASWISDTSGVLTPAAHARLDAKLRLINQSSANEVAALILPTLDGADIADVGDKTAKTWGVGKKDLDNGVLVVLAMKEHKSRISTGKGVEGDLPDLKANDILQNARPYLRKGDVEGALGFIFDSSSSAIANHKAEAAAAKARAASQPAPTATTATTSSSGTKAGCSASGAGTDGGSGLMLLLVGGGAALLVWYLASQAKKRREAEEAERLAAAQRQEIRRRQIEEREAARRRDAENARQAHLIKPPPAIPVPVVPRPTPRPVAPPVVHTAPVVHHKPVTHTVAPVVAAATVAAAVVAAEEEARHARAESDRRRREREEEDAQRARERAEEARRSRERDEEDRRRRDREDEDRRRRDSESSSSSSSSSSFDWGSSSGGSSGGFGGGDSGGGGSSSDW